MTDEILWRGEASTLQSAALQFLDNFFANAPTPVTVEDWVLRSNYGAEFTANGQCYRVWNVKEDTYAVAKCAESPHVAPTVDAPPT